MLDLEQEMSRCPVCPRKCGADREHGKTGYCKAPSGVAAARAALEALDRGWKLNWDAANPISLRLACKIGFEPDGEYEAVLVK